MNENMIYSEIYIYFIISKSKNKNPNKERRPMKVNCKTTISLYLSGWAEPSLLRPSAQ